MNRGISPEEAKRFYDRFGARQDRQGWYEDGAIRTMISLGRFGSARNVFELGFGTGRLAQTLLSDHLGEDSRYTGIEVSSTMHRLATDRLKPWADRIDFRLAGAGSSGATGEGPSTGLAPGSIDRFVSTYVLDLMEEEAIHAWAAEARRILAPDGLLCVVSLTHGKGPVSRLVSRTWERVQSASPERVGGCRPISPSKLLEGWGGWHIEVAEVTCALGVCSETCIASPREA